MKELHEDGTVVPKHVGEIKDYTAVYVLVALATENKSRNLTSTSPGIFNAWCLIAAGALFTRVREWLKLYRNGLF
jgi:hypothetical protein